MKKPISLTLALVLLATLLAGCGTTTSAPEPVKETVVVKETVEVPVEKTVEVPVEVTRIVEVAAGEAPVEAGPVVLEVFDPTGATEVTQLFSARLDTLDGKTICELSDAAWQDDRTFPLIREMLQKQFPTAKFIPYTEFSPEVTGATGPYGIDDDKTIAALKEKGCEGVIVGNAG